MKKNLCFAFIMCFVVSGLYCQNDFQSGTIEEPISNYGDSPRSIRSPQHVNGTFYTQYNGVRNGKISCFFWDEGDTSFYLSDSDAAVAIYRLGHGATTFPSMPNSYLNPSTIWGNPPSTIYANYVLDAYWAASQYAYYLQNHFNCPKGYFQRHRNRYGIYEICDTITPIFIADSAFFDNTHWEKYTTSGLYGSKDLSDSCHRKAIIIGSPGTEHNPKASIDDVVHEFAHIFSYQTWHTSSTNTNEDKLSEACADIWAAIITSTIYPNDENRIWKIGEDVVLPNSGNSCIRNLAVPNDPTAEMQMDTCICQESFGSTYQQSGIISHWFYLLTHGFSGKGCDGKCGSFPAMPIDSAAKLMYYAEKNHFERNMDFTDIIIATITTATEVFSTPSDYLPSICGAWNVLGASTCAFDEYSEFGIMEQLGLSLNSENSGEYSISHTITIDSLQVLTVSGTFYMNEGSRIIVRPGGKLIVDGGTLTSACDGEMWEELKTENGKRKCCTFAAIMRG